MVHSRQGSSPGGGSLRSSQQQCTAGTLQAQSLVVEAETVQVAESLCSSGIPPRGSVAGKRHGSAVKEAGFLAVAAGWQERAAGLLW